MKIVVTNPSGLTRAQLQDLRQLGEVVVYDDTNDETWLERMKDAEVAIIDCFLTPVTAELLAKAPSMKFFSVNSTGFDKVDVDAVKSAGVRASNVPHFSTQSVAEMAIGLMFAVNRKIPLGDKEFREGLVAVEPGTPEQTRYQGFDFAGKTIGIVGLGDIGGRIAEIGNGLGMTVIGYNRSERNLANVKQVSLENLVAMADVVVLSLALNNKTKGIITEELIENMKSTALFVSIAGLGLVDQDSLKNALNNNLIAGAGLDTAGEDWAGVRNTLLTPHIGYNTIESDENMGRIITENIKAYANGSVINPIA